MFDQGQILPTMIRPVRDLPEGLAPQARHIRSEPGGRAHRVLAFAHPSG
jgi:hypothetical protein